MFQKTTDAKSVLGFSLHQVKTWIYAVGRPERCQYKQSKGIKSYPAESWWTSNSWSNCWEMGEITLWKHMGCIFRECAILSLSGLSLCLSNNFSIDIFKSSTVIFTFKQKNWFYFFKYQFNTYLNEFLKDSKKCICYDH